MNTLLLVIGLIIKLLADWQLDILCSIPIGRYCKGWKFWIPLGIRKKFPFIVWMWKGTEFEWQDAYCIMFLMNWIGFIIVIISAVVS